MKAMIFGAGGQDGFYLTQLLLKKDIEVIGTDRNGSRGLKGDVGDYSFVEALIKKEKPDYVFHFAATSSTNHSALFDNHKAISMGTLNILESVKNHVPKSKVFLSGSALQFINKGVPINEKTPFDAKSAYAMERIQSVYAGRYYRDVFGMKVYIGYFFNHDSPIRPKQHVSQYIVSTIKRISKGSNVKLEIGDINVKKEFNFAGDIVKAVWLLVNQDKFYEAVIGSGIAYSLKEWIKYCFSKIGKNWKDFVVNRKDFKSEYKILVSDPKLIKSLGWKREVDIYKLADMMMENKNNDNSL
jgi:GDPmannose 4,6-dehydratase